jgi:hypothetical protein
MLGFGQPPEMVFPQIRVHEMDSFVAPLKAVFDEGAKHPVLLVHAMEKSADVTTLAENAARTLHGTGVRCHVSPPAATSGCQSRADASEQINLFKGLAQVTNDASGKSALANAIVRIRRNQDGWNGLPGSRQALMQFEPGHPGHLHIGNQAGSAADIGRT